FRTAEPARAARDGAEFAMAPAEAGWRYWHGGGDTMSVIRAIHDEGSAALPIKLLLTTEEAAHALGIKRTKLHELTVAGELESIKIGASRRFLTRSLVAYVERLRDLQKAG